MEFYTDPSVKYVPDFDDEDEPVIPEPTTVPEPAAPKSTQPAAPAKARVKGEFYTDPAVKYKPLYDKGSFIPETAKGVAAGTVSTTASTVKGLAGTMEAYRRGSPNFMKTALKVFDEIDKGDESLSNVGLSSPELMQFAETYRDLPPDQRAEFRAGMQENFAAQDKRVPERDIRESGIYQIGQGMQNWSDQQFQASKDYETSWTRKISEGLGSLAPTIAAAVLTRGTTGTMAVGYGMSGGEAIDRALAAGATPEQVMQVIQLGGLPGLTEAVPIETLFEKIPMGSWGKAAQILFKIGSQAVVEGGQEYAQQVLQNAVAKYVYKPDQDLTEGALEAAVIGAAVGSIAAAPVAPFTTESKPKTAADPVAEPGLPDTDAGAEQSTPGGGPDAVKPATAPLTSTEQAQPAAVTGTPQPASNNVTVVQPGQASPDLAAASAAGTPATSTPTPAATGAVTQPSGPPLTGASQPPSPAVDADVAQPAAKAKTPEEQAKIDAKAADRKRMLDAMGGTPAVNIVPDKTDETAAIAARQPAAEPKPAPEPAGTLEARLRVQQPMPPAPPSPPAAPPTAAGAPAPGEVDPSTLAPAAPTPVEEPAAAPAPAPAAAPAAAPASDPLAWLKAERERAEAALAAPAPAPSVTTPIVQPTVQPANENVPVTPAAEPAKLQTVRQAIQARKEKETAPAPLPAVKEQGKEVGPVKPTRARKSNRIAQMLFDEVHIALFMDPDVPTGKETNDLIDDVVDLAAKELKPGMAPRKTMLELLPHALAEAKRRLAERMAGEQQIEQQKVEAAHAKAQQVSEQQTIRRTTAKKEAPAKDVEKHKRTAWQKKVKANKAKPEAERDADVTELDEAIEARKKTSARGAERKAATAKVEAIKQRIIDRKKAEEAAAAPTIEHKPAPSTSTAVSTEVVTPGITKELSVEVEPQEGESEEDTQRIAVKSRERVNKTHELLRNAIQTVPVPDFNRMTLAKLKAEGRLYMQKMVAAGNAAMAAVGDKLRPNVRRGTMSPFEALLIFGRKQLATQAREPDGGAGAFIGAIGLMQGDRVSEEFWNTVRGEQMEGTTGEESVDTAAEKQLAARPDDEQVLRISHDTTEADEAWGNEPIVEEAPPRPEPPAISPKPTLDTNNEINHDDFYTHDPDERTTVTTQGFGGKVVQIEVHSTHSAATMLDLIGKESRVGRVFKTGGIFDLISRMHKKSLRNLVGTVPIHFISTDEMRKYRGGEPGGLYVHPSSFDQQQGFKPMILIDVNKFFKYDAEFRHHVIMHEVTHAATVEAYYSNINGTKDVIDEMMFSFRDKLQSAGILAKMTDYEKYGLTKGTEFIAQAFSDVRFQRLLAGIEVTNKVFDMVGAQAFHPNVTWPTWMNKFCEAVARALSLMKIMRGQTGMSYMEAVVHVQPSMMLSTEQQERFAADEVSQMLASFSESPALPPRGMFDTTRIEASVREQVEAKLRSTSGKTDNAMRYLRMKTATTMEHVRRSAAYFGGPGNVFETYAKGVLRGAQTLRNAARAGEVLIERMAEVKRKHYADFEKGSQILYDATIGKYNPMVGLKDPSNAHIKGGALDVHTRAAHARAAGEWMALHPEVKSSMKAWVEHLRQLEESRVEKVVRNIVRQAIRILNVTPPAGEDEASIIKWVLDGDVDRKPPADPANRQPGEQTTRDEAMHAALGKTAKTLKGSKDIRQIRGLYIPLMRSGDKFFSATHKVQVPTVANGRVVLDPTVAEQNVLVFDNKQDYLDYVKTAHTFDDRQIAKRPVIEHIDPLTGQNVGAKDVRGKEYYFVTIQNRAMEMGDNPAELEHLRKQYQANGFTTSEVGYVDKELNKESALLPAQAQRVLRSIQNSASSDAAAKANGAAFINAYIRQQAGSRAAHMRIKRKGIKGYSKDLLGNSLDANSMLSGQVANLDVIPELAEMENAVQDHLNDDAKRNYPSQQGDQLERGAMFAEVKKRSLAARAAGDNMIHVPVKYLLDLSFIARLMTPAYTAANILGGQAAGFSVLTGKHSAVQVMGAMKRAAGKLGASQVVGKGIMETLRETKNLVSAYGGKRTFSFYEDFIKSKFTAGSLELRFADQLEAHGLGVGSGLETSELSELNRGVGNKVMNRTMRVARAMPEAAETLNRYLTGLAALELAKSRGLSDEAAINEAIHAVEKSQGGYGVENNPAYFNNPLFRVTLQFKKYAQMYAQLYYGALLGVFGKSSYMTKKEAGRQLLSLTVTNVILSGAFGLPAMEMAKALAYVVQFMFGGDSDWEDWENWQQEMVAALIGNRSAEVLGRGVSRLAGIDLSNRLGNENLFLFGEPRGSGHNDRKAWLFDTIAGAPGALAYDTIYKAWGEGDYSKLPLPKFMSDAIKAVTSTQHGRKTPAGREVGEKLNIPEAIAKAAGFRPAKEAREYEPGGGGTEAKIDKRTKNARIDLIGQWRDAGPTQRQQFWQSQIMPWNKAHPEYRITFDALHRSINRQKQIEKEDKKRKLKRG